MAASPVRKVWEITKNSVDSKVSFQNIVDETLAEKLQDEEDCREYDVIKTPPKDYGVVVIEDENEVNTTPVELDADFALALQLQSQEDEEYENHVRKTRNTDTHINVVTRVDPLLDKIRLNNSSYSNHKIFGYIWSL